MKRVKRLILILILLITSLFVAIPATAQRRGGGGGGWQRQSAPAPQRIAPAPRAPVYRAPAAPRNNFGGGQRQFSPTPRSGRNFNNGGFGRSFNGTRPTSPSQTRTGQRQNGWQRFGERHGGNWRGGHDGRGEHRRGHYGGHSWLSFGGGGYYGYYGYSPYRWGWYRPWVMGWTFDYVPYGYYGYGYCDSRGGVKFNTSQISDRAAKKLVQQAEVYADGGYVGVVKDFDGRLKRTLRLEAGEHQIEVVFPNGNTIPRSVTVRNCEVTVVHTPKLPPPEETGEKEEEEESERTPQPQPLDK